MERKKYIERRKEKGKDYSHHSSDTEESELDEKNEKMVDEFLEKGVVGEEEKAKEPPKKGEKGWVNPHFGS